MAEPAGTVDPIPVYPSQCLLAVMGARKFMKDADWPKVPMLKHEFVRISEKGSVPIRGHDGPRLEFQARKLEEFGGQELVTDNEELWKAIKKSALKYGVSRQEDNKEHDPCAVLGKRSDLRVRWILKDLTPAQSAPSEGSPKEEFTNVVWNCDKVRDLTSSNVSPKNDNEAAVQINEYMGTRGSGAVWWREFEEKVKSALKPDYADNLAVVLRQTRAAGGDTGPLRSEDEVFAPFREARKQAGQEPPNQ